MPWKCYSCETSNPNSADVCQKCGGTVAAPARFYGQWVLGGAVFFLIVYLAGVLAGGVLIESYVRPTDEALLKEINATRNIIRQKEPYTSIEAADNELTIASKAVLITRGKAAIPIVVGIGLQWIFPFLMFIICGMMVGFISDGKTIIEAGIASVLGQVGGFFIFKYGFSPQFGFVQLVAGLIIGFGLALLGAWVGEIIQERKERAGGISA